MLLRSDELRLTWLLSLASLCVHLTWIYSLLDNRFWLFRFKYSWVSWIFLIQIYEFINLKVVIIFIITIPERAEVTRSIKKRWHTHRVPETRRRSPVKIYIQNKAFDKKKCCTNRMKVLSYQLTTKETKSDV